MKYTVLKVIDITRNEAGKTRYNAEYFVNYLDFLYISCYAVYRGNLEFILDGVKKCE